MTTAEIIGALVALLAKIAPDVVAWLSASKANGTLPESLRDAVEKLDPPTVFDAARAKLDAMDAAPPTQLSP